MTAKKARPKFDAEPVYALPVPKRDPVGYHIIVRPRPAPTTLGSGILASSKRTRKAQEAVCTIGEVVKIGALAWKSGTPDMDPQKDPVAQSILPGDWIVYRQHSGQKLRFKNQQVATDDEEEGKFLLFMADTDVLYVFESRQEAEQYTDWV